MFDMAASQRYPEMSTAWDKLKHLMQADLPKNATVEAGSWRMLARHCVTKCDLSTLCTKFWQARLGADFRRSPERHRDRERDGEKQRTWLCQAMRCHAPRRILSSLPPDVRRRRCLGVLGSLNYVAIFLWLCEQFNANRLFVMILWWFMCLFTYWSIACREDAKRRCLMSLQCCHSRHWFLCLVSANAPEGWSPKKIFMNTAQALCWDETEAWGHWHQ